MFDRIFGQPSARVVALARLGLSAVFFLATLADPPAQVSPLIIPTLTGFLCFSMVVAYLTWSDWWMDARIAIATHVIDVCFFVSVVGSPEGYSSPYFLFFVFLLLSSAIRWTWRETGVTAAIVIALYVIAGLLLGMTDTTPFETRRFIIRSGYLMILSIVLIWFGIRRRFSDAGAIADPVPGPSMSNEPPLATALRQALRATGARQAVGYWTFADGRQEALVLDRERLRPAAAAELPAQAMHHAFLFDAKRDRALVNAGPGRLQFTRLTRLVGEVVAGKLSPGQGLAIPTQSKLGEGVFLLRSIPDLHSDHLALGERLRSELAHLIERYALFSALRDSAIASERLGIARDLHDGVVQFLAGSAYKIEAISRSNQSERVTHDLQELKQLMLLEQEDLRSSIGTLRKDKVSLADTKAEAQALCGRLARQWHVTCSFVADLPEVRLPARLHMNLLHMIKEGVANAVRHAAADSVRVQVSGDQGQLRLTVANQAANSSAGTVAVPWSIRERVQDLGGSASVSAEAAETILTVTIPIPDETE